VASAHYESLAVAHDFAFRALVSAEENHELFDHPDFWHPRKTARLSARWGVRFLRRQYELLSSLVREDSVLVANPGVFAAPMVHEKSGHPWASLILQPGLIPSSIAPPIMPGFAFLRRAPRWVWRLFWRGLDAVGDVLVGGELNSLRTSLGLKPMRRIFQNWLSPQLVLGMFPDWYGPPQPDWPPQIQLAGFPLADGGRSNGLADEVLNFCRSGPPPVAFTFGTGMRHSAALFHAAGQASEICGARAIFLTKHHDQLPDPLPSSVLHCDFAPFQQLFPHCAAVVHHGGIGTVAQAMATGTPQLIHPICFDQMDNGARVKQLGAGDALDSRHCSPQQIAHALSKLLTPEMRSRCCAISARFAANDALETAARQIENLAAIAVR
jgi:UDP:flavonoid glycosyltransferase YjiC (YdhE family)